MRPFHDLNTNDSPVEQPADSPRTPTPATNYVDYSPDQLSFSQRVQALLLSLAQFVGRIFIWSTMPIRWLIIFIEFAFGSLTHGVDHAGSTIARIVSLVLAPFRAVAHALAWLADWLHLRPALTTTYRAFGLVFTFLTHPFVAGASFIFAYVRTRTYRLIVYGIPLLVIALVVILVHYQVSHWSKAEIIENYRRQLTLAIDKQDLSKVDFLQQKMRQLGAPVDAFDLRVSDELVRNGEVKRAFDLVSRLAPLDRPGLPEAHLWLAMHLLGQVQFDDSQLDIEPTERYRLALQHIAHARKSKGFQIQAGLLEATALSDMGQLREARDILSSSKSEDLISSLLRFRLALQSGDLEASTKEAEVVSRIFRLNGLVKREAQPAALHMWLMAEVLTGQQEQAELVAEYWHDRFPQDLLGTQLWVSLRLDKFDRKLRTGFTHEHSELCHLLIETYNRTGQLAGLSLQQRLLPVFADAFRGNRRFQDFLATLGAQELTADLLELLGTTSAQAGDHKTARRLLERSLEIEPTRQTALNNLAYLLLIGFPEDLTLAHDLAAKASQISPDDLHTLDTYARVLVAERNLVDAKKVIERMLTIDPTSQATKNLLQELQTSNRKSKD